MSAKQAVAQIKTAIQARYSFDNNAVFLGFFEKTRSNHTT
jgi:hypothetical protein